MNTLVLIGLRFVLSRNTTRFLSLVTRVSVFGLALGVMALLIVVSVMNGFDSQLKYRILGAVPHVITHHETDAVEVKGSAEFLRNQGMLLGGESRLVSIYGIDPEQESEVSVLPAHMQQGQLNDLTPGSYQIILGAGLAARLGLWSGDKTTLLIPVATAAGSNVVPKIARVTVGGHFRLDSELDHNLVLIHVRDLQELTGATQTYFRHALNNVFSAGALATAEPENVLSTWFDDFGDFFAAVRMEKIMMFLLLTMIVLIAALNTVSGLSMMVKEKQSEIAVLRTMGLAKNQISLIFVIQGSLIGVSGVLLGVILGLPIAYHVTEVVGFFENLFGARMLAGTYFDRVPTDVRWLDVVLIASVSLIIAIAATLYPAYRAGRLNPAEVLRAE